MSCIHKDCPVLILPSNLEYSPLIFSAKNETSISSVSANSHHSWTSRLDGFCSIVGALVPVGYITGNAIFESMIALVCACWITRCILVKKIPIATLRGHPLILPWLAWWIAVVASLIWNGPGTKGWGHDVALIRYLIFFTSLMDISYRRSLSKMLLMGLIAGIFWATLNILSADITGIDLIGRPLSRYQGKIKEAERIANLAAYACPFFLAWAFLDQKKTKYRRLLIFGFGVMATVQIVYVQIRTAAIGALAGMGYLFFYFLKAKMSRYVWIVSVLIPILVGGIYLKLGSLPEMDLRSTYDRLNFWNVSWELWKEHPFLGVSVSAWQDAYVEKLESGTIPPIPMPDGTVIQSPRAKHAHNLLFQLISSTGLLGLFTFGWLFIQALKLIYHYPDNWRLGLISWPATFLAIGLTGWNIYASQYQLLFSFFMVLIGIEFKKAPEI